MTIWDSSYDSNQNVTDVIYQLRSKGYGDFITWWNIYWGVNSTGVVPIYYQSLNGTNSSFNPAPSAAMNLNLIPMSLIKQGTVVSQHAILP